MYRHPGVARSYVTEPITERSVMKRAAPSDPFEDAAPAHRPWWSFHMDKKPGVQNCVLETSVDQGRNEAARTTWSLKVEPDRQLNSEGNSPNSFTDSATDFPSNHDAPPALEHGPPSQTLPPCTLPINEPQLAPHGAWLRRDGRDGCDDARDPTLGAPSQETRTASTQLPSSHPAPTCPSKQCPKPARRPSRRAKRMATVTLGQASLSQPLGTSWSSPDSPQAPAPVASPGVEAFPALNATTAALGQGLAASQHDAFAKVVGAPGSVAATTAAQVPGGSRAACTDTAVTVVEPYPALSVKTVAMSGDVRAPRAACWTSASHSPRKSGASTDTAVTVVEPYPALSVKTVAMSADVHAPRAACWTSGSHSPRKSSASTVRKHAARNAASPAPRGDGIAGSDANDALTPVGSDANDALTLVGSDADSALTPVGSDADSTLTPVGSDASSALELEGLLPSRGRAASMPCPYSGTLDDEAKAVTKVAARRHQRRHSRDAMKAVCPGHAIMNTHMKCDSDGLDALKPMPEELQCSDACTNDWKKLRTHLEQHAGWKRKQQGNTHYHFYRQYKGMIRPQLVTCPCTPSDEYHGIQNFKCKLRKQDAELKEKHKVDFYRPQ